MKPPADCPTDSPGNTRAEAKDITGIKEVLNQYAAVYTDDLSGYKR